jgi:hypothetical protein
MSGKSGSRTVFVMGIITAIIVVSVIFTIAIAQPYESTSNTSRYVIKGSFDATQNGDLIKYRNIGIDTDYRECL